MSRRSVAPAGLALSLCTLVAMPVSAWAGCDNGWGDVCYIVQTGDGVDCRLWTDNAGVSDTALTVNYHPKTLEFEFVGNDEDGTTFDCWFDRGTDVGEIHPASFSLRVFGSANADDVQVNYFFQTFVAKTYGGNDRVIGPPGAEFVTISVSAGNDWVSADVEEQGSILLGEGDDTAILDGTASSGFIDIEGTGSGENCVLGSPNGRDRFVGGDDPDKFNSRGPVTSSEAANGNGGIDTCWPVEKGWAECNWWVPFTVCPAYSP